MQDEHNQAPQAPTMAELLTRTTDLVSLPAVYFEVQRIVDDPDSTIIDLSRAIALEPALTARLLRIVNSAFYAQSRPVETVSRAVNMLGTQQIHDLVLVTSLCTAFSQDQADTPEMRTFWHNSVHRAVLAREIAKRIDLGAKERLFVLGLLSDLGLLTLWLHLPELSKRLQELSQQRGEPLHQTELSQLGYDHAELGGALLAAWKLPPSLHQPISNQRQFQAQQPFAMEAAYLHIVGRMVEATERGLAPLSLIDEAAWALVGGDAPAIAIEVLGEVNDEVARIHSVFFPENGT